MIRSPAPPDDETTPLPFRTLGEASAAIVDRLKAMKKQDVDPRSLDRTA